jgi:hypothetical protein
VIVGASFVIAAGLLVWLTMAAARLLSDFLCSTSWGGR